ncbi:MAG: hypothetical protein Q8S00_01790 [Deltaproteobacteria bacterium]|nr:hypothetical protein [Deltaproteobacteria bacterium]MDZ4346276.1 hypothetical protein [Candidatus Binatia bacterium]
MKKQDLSQMIQAARVRQGLHYLCGYIDAYCDNAQCTAREIRVRIKTYVATDPVKVLCPLCGKLAKLNSVETLREHVKDTERKARVDVNVQRYLARTGRAYFPASLLFNDTLPG